MANRNGTSVVYRGARKRYPFYEGFEETLEEEKELIEQSLYKYFKLKVLPLALQYGMTPNQFWHDDMELLDAYAKSYYLDKSYTGWQIGQHAKVAMELAYANAWSKKGSKRLDYPKWESPLDKINEKLSISSTKVTRENLEEIHRATMITQQEWLLSGIKNSKKMREKQEGR